MDFKAKKLNGQISLFRKIQTKMKTKKNSRLMRPLADFHILKISYLSAIWSWVVAVCLPSSSVTALETIGVGVL